MASLADLGRSARQGGGITGALTTLTNIKTAELNQEIAQQKIAANQFALNKAIDEEAALNKEFVVDEDFFRQKTKFGKGQQEHAVKNALDRGFARQDDQGRIITNNKKLGEYAKWVDLNREFALESANIGLAEINPKISELVQQQQEAMEKGDEKRARVIGIALKVSRDRKAELEQHAIFLDKDLRKEAIKAGFNQEAELSPFEKKRQETLGTATGKAQAEAIFGIKDSDDVFEKTIKIRDQFNKLPEVKDFKTVRTQVGKMNRVWGEFKEKGRKNFAAVDQALVIVFNKMLDPDSVVRESEFARTPEGIAVIGRAEGFFQRLRQGGVGLRNEDRDEIVRVANELFTVHQEEMVGVRDEFTEFSKVFNVDPNLVVGDIGGTAQEQVAPQGKPPLSSFEQ
jgi:hypothetical protein